MVKTVRRFAFPAVLERYGDPTPNADGFPVSTVTSTERIQIHAHPAKGDDLVRLPEGVERKGVYQGYTPADLYIGDDDPNGRPGDVVAMFGRRYRVVEESPWAGGGSGRQTWRQCLLVEVRA